MNSYITGRIVFDELRNQYENIVNHTSNSFEVTQKRITEKGINYTNWYSALDKSTKERFTIIS